MAIMLLNNKMNSEFIIRDIVIMLILIPLIKYLSENSQLIMRPILSYWNKKKNIDDCNIIITSVQKGEEINFSYYYRAICYHLIKIIK